MYNYRKFFIDKKINNFKRKYLTVRKLFLSEKNIMQLSEKTFITGKTSNKNFLINRTK